MDQLEETGDFSGQDALSSHERGALNPFRFAIPDRLELTFLDDVLLLQTVRCPPS